MKHLSDFISEIVGETVHNVRLEIAQNGQYDFGGRFMGHGRVTVGVTFDSKIKLPVGGLLYGSLRLNWQSSPNLSTYSYQGVFIRGSATEKLFKQLAEAFSV